ncbi:MAG: HU family DNA-binding protein [Chlorobi bacterium]|nr:HU family DNA-binding protein [Chlorobiota bacterium]
MAKTKKEFVSILAMRMGATEKTASEWVNAYTETMVDIFKTGEGVTIDGFGDFYCEGRI